jgi:hypothetical protein
MSKRRPRVTESGIKQLQAALKRIGWSMITPEFNKEGHFEGAIVGTHAFCSAVMSLIKGEEGSAEGSERLNADNVKVEGE